MTTGRNLVATVAVVLAIAATGALGLWQVRRGEQKEALQDAARSVAKEAPTTLSTIAADDAAALVGRHVRLKGRWIPDRVVYLDNRQHDGQPGFNVVMALRPGSGGPILVDRGWIPRAANDRTLIAPYRTVDEPTEVVGVVLADEPRLLELGQGPERRLGGIWQNFDFDAYERAAGSGVVRLIVREDAASGDPHDGLVRASPDAGGALQAQIDRHHGYAFQWFAMAVGLAGWLVYRFVRARRTPSPSI